MTNQSVVGNHDHPEAIHRIFRLPAELRLLICAFVFAGCQATVTLDGEFGQPGDYVDPWHGRRRKVLFRDGQCCYEHFGGGFALLTTCRAVFGEALDTYWSQTVLTVSRNVFPRHAACELRHVCAYLPAAVKKSLRHLRNTKLPILDRVRPAEGDPDWTPALLEQLPVLKSCAFAGRAPLAGGLRKPYSLRVPDSQNLSREYVGAGPFQVQGAESPAAFIERRLGVQQSCEVKILSMARGEVPRARPAGYRPRCQYFNYTTGMVYQTTVPTQYEGGFEEAMEAKEGSEWRRCYHVRRD